MVKSQPFGLVDRVLINRICTLPRMTVTMVTMHRDSGT